MRRVACLTAVLALVGILVVPQLARAQAEPFIGQLMLFAGNFCPVGWAAAAGQLMPIAQNTALFSILGTTYGGNGTSTFALPDLRGRVPLSQGQGPGLSNYTEGQTGGAESHTLVTSEMPRHFHQAYGSAAAPSTLVPTGAEVASQDRVKMYTAPGSEVPMAAEAIGLTGGSQPFDMRTPYLTLQWCIALQGIYPSRP